MNTIRNFETVIVLEIITGICLRKDATIKKIVEIVAYLCDMGKQEDISKEQFSVCWKVNIDLIIKEIINQHPMLIPIREESSKLKTILKGRDWVDWANNKIISLGKKLPLSPIKDNVNKVLPAQDFVFN